MKEIYLTIGILQTVVSNAVLIYFLMLHVQKYKYPNRNYSLSHGFFTSAMGVLYIVSSIILPNEQILSKKLGNESSTYLEGFNQTKNLEYTNSFNSITEESNLHMDTISKNNDSIGVEDIYDIEREYFKKFLEIKGYIMHKDYPRELRNLHLKKMSCKEMLFMYLLLVCSFVHGMVHLLANSVFTNLLLKQNNGNYNLHHSENSDKLAVCDTSTNIENGCKQQPTTKQGNAKFAIALITVSEWVLPIIGGSMVLLMINNGINNNNVPYQNIINTAKLRNENDDNVNMNISLYPEVQNILNKVYNIVKDVNLTKNERKPNITLIQVLNNNIYTCSDESIILRTYLFILFVIGYLLTISYSKSTLKLPVQTSDYNGINKKLTFSFTITWLPAVLEIIIRKYIGNSTPSSISEFMLLIGAFHQIFTNILNMYTAKKFIKSLNFIEPHK